MEKLESKIELRKKQSPTHIRKSSKLNLFKIWHERPLAKHGVYFDFGKVKCLQFSQISQEVLWLVVAKDFIVELK